MIAGQPDGVGLLLIGLSLFTDTQQTVVLNFFDDESLYQTVTDNGVPILGILFPAHPKHIELFVGVGLHRSSGFAHQHIDHMVGLKFLLNGRNHLQHFHNRFLSLKLLLGMQTVIARVAVVFLKLLPEIVQEQFASTKGGFGISDRLEQQLATTALLGQGLALHKLLELLNVFVTVKSDAASFAAIATGATGLLVIT